MSKSDEVHCFIGNSVGKVGDTMKFTVSLETVLERWRRDERWE